MRPLPVLDISTAPRALRSCSPFSIWVMASVPVFCGTNSGVGGRSRKASVCVEVSASGTVSVSSSRYTSVWMSMCRRPSTASGVRGGSVRVVLFFLWKGKDRVGNRRTHRSYPTEVALGAQLSPS